MPIKFKKLLYVKSVRIIIDRLWRDNPIFSMCLGVCSALAVTNKVENAIAMGVGVTFVLVASSVIISFLRKLISSRIRMIIYMVTISTFVIVVDRLLKAFFPSISEAIGPYIGLIITNCLIMGRADAFAIKNEVRYSALDGLASGIGYSYTLIIISIIREVLAFGSVLGMKVTPEWWTNWVVMAMAPGAFFVLSIFLWITRNMAKIQPEK
ncbi:MAG: NADH:ubiquinone reductase (Na(+)-transporting) subunit D [Armatimonadetes bacterium]|nr:NADH:ubiquinone reductase (Na(+)-transporting) subunit D [Armatimonadota bacterium]